jgi:hypothetical protein
MIESLRRLLPGLWAGWLLCVAASATATAFAVLPREQAGALVARVLAQEATLSLVLAVLLLMLERRAARDRFDAGSSRSQFSPEMALVAAALFCTVAGYFALQPMMDAARAVQGRWSFAQLHAVSLGFFALKGVLVLALAWRAARPVGADIKPFS